MNPITLSLFLLSAFLPFALAQNVTSSGALAAANDIPAPAATLRITEPLSGSIHPAGRMIEIKAVAIDPAGFIPRVEFYANGQLIGVSEVAFIQPPAPGTPVEHSFIWRTPPYGRSTLVAKARDAHGNSVISPEVVLSTTDEWPVVSVRATRQFDSTEPYPDSDFAPGVFEFRRHGLTNASLLVFFETGGTATPKLDYAPLGSSVLFPAGKESVLVRVSAIDDALAEGTETVVVALREPPAGTLTGFPTSYRIDAEHRRAELVILDNEPAPAGARISITRPSEGEVFSAGRPIGIEAVAIDPEGYIPRVEFFANDVRIGVSEIVFIRAPDPGTPIHHSLVWSNAPAGEHHLRAVGIASDATRVTSEPVTIMVRSGKTNQPPVASVVRPGNGSVYSEGQSIGIYARGDDADGRVTLLELFAGDQLLARSTESSFTWLWSNAPAGEHALRARAIDDRGASAESAPVRILVRTRSETAWVTRELPVSYTPGTSFTVHLKAAPSAATLAYAIEEVPPREWTPSRISHGGIFDASLGKVKFGPFNDAQARDLTYVLTPPAGSTGQREFSGASSADGRLYDIAGDRVLDSAARLHHPADTNEDNKITLVELTGYSAAWKKGAAWETPPNPIPIPYVTQAGSIWRRGESYQFNPALAAPQCWMPEGPEIRRFETSAPGFARRTTAATPSGATLVRVEIQPGPASAAYAVEERLPAGWRPAGISDEGIFDPASGYIRWGLYMDGATRILTYEMTPPSESASVGEIQGQVSFDGLVRVTEGTSGAVAIDPTAQLSIPAVERSEGAIRLRLAGAAGQVCILESSPDLQEWGEVREVFLPDGTLEFVDDSPQLQPRRYYRLRVR